MSEIDWSKAPNGATHYNHASPSYPWLKSENDKCFFWIERGLKWMEYPKEDFYIDLQSSTPRPQENEMKPHPQAEVLHMIADGHQGPWEHSTDEEAWCRTPSPLSALASGRKVRLAPRTIKIGDVEVPAPERAHPARGTEYWSISPERVTFARWDADEFDVAIFELNRIWLKQEHAQQAFDAITSLLGGE